MEEKRKQNLGGWGKGDFLQSYSSIFQRASPDHISLLNFHNNCHPYIYSTLTGARISHSLFSFLFSVLQPALFSVTQGTIKHKIRERRGGKTRARTKGTRFKPFVLPYNLQCKRKIYERKNWVKTSWISSSTDVVKHF